MCDQYHRDPFHIIECPHRAHHLFASVGIQHRCGFIQNNTLRVHGDNACNGDTLLLSAGKLIRRMFPVLIHSHSLQAFFHPLPDFLRGHTHILRPKPYILLHYLTNDLVVRILKDHPGFLADIPKLTLILGVHSIHPYSTLCGIENRINVLGKRRLPGTIVTQNGYKITLLYVQVHLIHRTGNAFHITFLIPSYIFKYQFVCLYDSHFTLP